MEPIILPAKGLWAGFTGTRGELTLKQKGTLTYCLVNFQPAEVHHGDCEGADTVCHYQCMGLRIKVVIHPPIDNSKRAYCGGDRNLIHTVATRPYLQRNHDIVDGTNYLIAVTKTFTETLRSGTWATVRYAKKRGRPVYVIYPDGRLDRLEPDV
jgi:hypothetical protein